MASKRCHFRRLWMDDPDYASWLQEVKDEDQKAYCIMCKKSFDVGNMGIAALKSHMKSRMHEKTSAQSKQSSVPSITSFFSVKTARSTDHDISPGQLGDIDGSTMPSIPTTSYRSTETTAVTSDEVLKAEVIWVLKVVMSHYSFNSCQDVSQVFSKMFPDSPIAKAFSCGATKCAYLVCFGLHPYFHDLLVDQIRSAECYSVSFDECMNNISQNEQMDFIVRYWDSNTSQVAVRYLGSEFLGHATASDLLNHFKQGTSQLDPKQLLQVSMDGPNVNLKFYKDLVKERQLEELPELLDIGSCGLHIVHGSLQKGVSEAGWKLGNLLRSLWQLFHDTPARREDFVTITGNTIFPLHFCAHRWVEDAKVVERALQMWTDIEKYVSSFKDPKKAPNTVSFGAVKAACEDPFTTPKLEFFVSVAKQLQTFLTRFQTDAPMAPFLGYYLKDLMLSLMSRFMKKEVLDKANTYQKLASLDPQDKKNQILSKYVDVGFSARQSIKKLTDKKTVSELRVLGFRTECISLLAALTSKLIERSPLKYSLVRYLSSLSPQTMMSTSTDAAAKFEKILQMLLHGKWQSGEQCDELLSQYKSFLIEMKQEHATEFSNFTADRDGRLDTFLGQYLKDPKFVKLWDVFKMLMTISHGQASVERGYSINSDLLVENMQEKTVVALRNVYDSVSATGLDYSEIPITSRLKRNVKAARMRYQQHLDDQKKAKIDDQKAKKRKAVQDDIHESEKKKRLLESTIQSLNKEADELAKRAENRHNFTLLSKSNAFRLKVSEKTEESQKLERKLKELKDKLKSME